MNFRQQRYRAFPLFFRIGRMRCYLGAVPQPSLLQRSPCRTSSFFPSFPTSLPKRCNFVTRIYWLRGFFLADRTQYGFRIIRAFAAVLGPTSSCGKPVKALDFAGLFLVSTSETSSARLRKREVIEGTTGIRTRDVQFGNHVFSDYGAQKVTSFTAGREHSIKQSGLKLILPLGERYRDCP